MGLLCTGSARASFLTQTSVVLTPLLSVATIGPQSVASAVWWGCGIALGGLTLLSGVTTTAGDGGVLSMAFSQGDLLVLGGALSWSGYLFRLSQIAGQHSYSEINLQAIKTGFLALFYSAWLLMEITTTGVSWAWAGNLAAWGALLFSALGPGTLADVLQQQGQKHVTAAEANVLLSMEPVFAAVFAFVLLGEVTTWTETLGGGLILLAALVATQGSAGTGTKE
uniref:EamA domain-containing protein n=1 Tax=Entomoneis paludosa TaxID=265537 RepID=A0A6U3BKJ9_9STRA